LLKKLLNQEKEAIGREAGSTRRRERANLAKSAFPKVVARIQLLLFVIPAVGGGDPSFGKEI